MAEKIVLFELDLKADAVQDKIVRLRSEIDKLKNSKRDLTKETKALIKEEEALTQQLFDLEKQGKKNSKEYRQTAQRLAEVRQQQKQYTKALIDTESRIKELNGDYRQLAKAVEYSKNKSLENLGVIAQTDGSIRALGLALSNNKKIYAQLSKEERENEQIGGRLKKLIQEQDAEYKRLNMEIGNTAVNVGNYKESIKQALAETGLLGRAQAQVNGVLMPFKTILTAAKVQLKSNVTLLKQYIVALFAAKSAQDAVNQGLGVMQVMFKLLKLAIAATGIGALVMALGTLVSFFTRTQRGADKLRVALAGVKAIINVVIDRMSKIGGAIIGLITGNKSLSQAWKETKDAMKGVGDEMRREFVLAQKLERKLIDLKNAEILLRAQYALQKVELAKLKNIYDDTTRSTEERLAALDKAEQIEMGLIKRQEQIAQGQLAVALGYTKVNDKVLEIMRQLKEGSITMDELISKFGISESKVSDVEKVVDSIAKLSKKEEAIIMKRAETERKRATILQQQRRKWQQARQKQIEEELRMEELRLEMLKETMRKELSQTEAHSEMQLLMLKAARKKIYVAELALLKDKLDKGKITQQEFDLEALKLKNEFYDQLKELDANYEAWVAEQRQAAEEARRSAAEKRLEELRAQYDYERQLAELDAQDKLTIAKMRFDQETALLQEQLNNKLIAQEEYERKMTLLKRQYEKTRERITWEKTRAEMDALTTVFGTAKQLFRQNTAEYKAMAVAETTMNTWKAVMQIWANKTTLPSPLNEIYKGVMSGLIVARGMMSVDKIMNTPVRYAKGGIVGGRLHNAGGTKYVGEDGQVFEVERGETMLVLNRRATPYVLPYLDRINRMTGGASLFAGRSFLASGGMVAPQVSDAGKVSELINRRIEQIKVVNVATETAEVAGDVVQVKNSATF